jgi:hypothetical protein
MPTRQPQSAIRIFLEIFMPRTYFWAVAVGLLAAPIWAADIKYTVKQETTAAPKELKEPIRQLLSDRTVQVVDHKGGLLAEFWFRKEVPVKAAVADVKKGLSEGLMEQTTLIGAVQLSKEWTDFRKQKIKPGVYTLRFALQPQDGDHMGSAPNREFCLLVPAKADEKPDLMEFKHLFELSCKATGGSHAGALLLYRNEKLEDAPSLVSKGGGIWALNWKADVNAGGQKVALGLGFTILGHTTAE